MSFSFRLGGSLPSALDECHQIATQAATFIVDWLANDERIGFSPNTVITDIAYCCTFLIRASQPCFMGLGELTTPELTDYTRTQYSRMRGVSAEAGFAPVKELCLRVIGVLATIGAARLNG